MNQLCLVLPMPTARKRDPETSREAARKAATFANNHRDRIHAALVTPGTIFDIAKRTGLDHVAVARRMVELQRMGLVERTGITRDGGKEWRRI